MKGIAKGTRTSRFASTGPRTRELLEHSQGEPDKVDRTTGTIHGVKILGQTSKNLHGVRGADETYYTDDALKGAASLYEGIPVHFDHPPKNERGEARKVDDRAGKFVNVQFRPGHGLYGDLKVFHSDDVFKTDRRVAKLFEAAESKEFHNSFACSHHAFGQGAVQNGRYVVNRIPVVKSVDIVTDAGTVRSLFEGRSTMKKISEVLESLEAKLDEAKRPTLRLLLEADVLPDAEMDDAAGDEGDPDDKMLAAFKAALCAVIDDDSLSEAEQLSKIKEILKAKAKLMGSGEEESADDSESESGSETEAETKESLREVANKNPHVKRLLESYDGLKTKVRESSRKAKNRRLLEAAKLPEKALSKTFVQLIEDAPGEAEVRRLIEDRRSLVGVGKPKSATAGHGAQLGGGSVQTTEIGSFSRQVRGY